MPEALFWFALPEVWLLVFSQKYYGGPSNDMRMATTDLRRFIKRNQVCRVLRCHDGAGPARIGAAPLAWRFYLVAYR